MSSSRAFVFGFMLGLALLSVAYAATMQQIWNDVYDSTNTALRINDVSP